MNFRPILRTLIYLPLAALVSCYAQVENSDVAYLQSNVCGAGCAGNSIPLTLASNFAPPLSVALGNAGLLTSAESKQGPITFKGGLLLNQVLFTMTSPDAGNFSGVRTAEVRAAAGSDTCAQLSATCLSVASYDSTRDGVAQKRLVLRGSGANLSELAGPSGRLSVYVRATGNAPSVPAWNADLELDMAIKTRGSFP